MTAPLSQRLRCALSGHQWRRAIAPREGYYLRCRRCWATDQAEAEAQAIEVTASNWHRGGLQRQV